MDSMIDLIPCPFCGCESLWLRLDEWSCAAVECNKCDAVGPRVSLGRADGDEEKARQMAAELWNTRQAQVVND